jgi:hypothetical protein
MDECNERGQEKRLGYQWPVWFSEDFTETLSQGLMNDVSSGGIGFSCGPNDPCPREGQHLTVRFSIPRFEGDDPTATISITRTGEVRRVERTEDGLYRVGIEFDTPLGLRPAEVSSLNAMVGGGGLKA